jgi:hypothetical protein
MLLRALSPLHISAVSRSKRLLAPTPARLPSFTPALLSPLTTTTKAVVIQMMLKPVSSRVGSITRCNAVSLGMLKRL